MSNQKKELKLSNVIQFLESMGRAPLSAADYVASVTALNVDASQQQALLTRDHAALNKLLDGRNQMYFMVVAEEQVLQ
jgi:glutamate synthase domain-containing protein 1